MKRSMIGIAFCGVLLACSAPASSSGAIQVSATPQAALGTPIPTLTSSRTPAVTPNGTAPKDTLLTLNDVPAGFRLTVDSENTVADFAKGANVDPALMQQTLTSRGWIGSWHRTFAKDGFGLQQINDSVSKYQSSDGSKLGLAENVRVTTTATPPGVQVSMGGTQLGDETLAFQIDTTSNGNQFTTFVIYFRSSGFSNSVAVSGTRGLTDLATAIDLAKKQLDREK